MCAVSPYTCSKAEQRGGAQWCVGYFSSCWDNVTDKPRQEKRVLVHSLMDKVNPGKETTMGKYEAASRGIPTVQKEGVHKKGGWAAKPQTLSPVSGHSHQQGSAPQRI